MPAKAYSSFFFQIPQLPQTAPPVPTRRPPSHFKSFLSLEIADSVLSRSNSVRSDIDDRSIYSQSTASSFYPATRESPRKARKARPSRSTSPSSQSSAQRPLPHPKPAPQAILPEVPYSSSSRPTYSRAKTTPAVPRSRSRAQAPPVPAYSSPTEDDYYSPRARPPSTMTGTSAASTHYRYTKRTDALARLEGRAPTSAYAARPPSPPPYSPLDAVHRTKSAAPVLATKSFMPFSEEDSDSDDYELEDWQSDVRVELVAMPSSPDVDTYKRSRERKGRSRAGTIESWFVGPPQSAPVPKNFMDF